MQISLSDRTLAAARIFSAVDTHFAHWPHSGGLDFDAAYEAYASDICETADRRDFALRTMRLLASLRNGHTDLFDEWLWTSHNRSFGFYATPLDGRWTVTASINAAIPIGDEVVSVDGVPIDAFFQGNRAYLCTSSERAAMSHLFARRYLFPETFEVELATTGRIRCAKTTVTDQVAGSDPLPNVRELDGVPVLKIPSFEDDAFEDRAVELIAQLRDREAIVIDVRGNGGGSTPMKFVETLMDRPYRMWTEVSNFTISAQHAEQAAMASGLRRPERADRPYLVVPSPLIEPSDDTYAGRLVVLIDEYCNSATEDLLLPLSQEGRAVFVGNSTAGSSGQPYIERIGDGMMLRVGAKRQLFPNGDEFEGRGFDPHTRHLRTADEVRRGVDGALEVALGVAQREEQVLGSVSRL